MKNQIIPLEDSNLYRSFVVLEDQILIGASRGKSIQEMIEKSAKSYWLGGVKSITLANLKELEFYDGSKELLIKYKNKAGDNKTITVCFESDSLPTQVSEHLMGELNLKLSQLERPTYKKILPDLFGIVFSLVAGWLFYQEALTYEQTGEIERTSGRAKGKILSMIVLKLSDLITPLGILILGFCIAIYFAYRLKTTLGKSQSVYVYKSEIV